ncbi:hypothetical protein [Inhella gelatinilytica]|uniref:DUF4214 domain-containing protein n=1 Tax=Inhella gelatinilytica TaxID=2795030 RepID=A0A931IXZ9_9BURK|nr:hypothetical protein [Inhella gelatinilytica]MBH9552688.1 hypothetical protein [Inhella gelatinilytica]
MATYRGTSRDDTWTIVENGRYTIDGLAGTDTVSFGIQPRSYFIITRNLDGSIQVDTVSGASGGGMQATLYNVEVLKFANGADAVRVSDLFPTGWLTGSAGNDAFTAASGVQSIDGLEGVDSVSFGNTRGNFLLAHGATDWTVTATAGTSTTSLKNIERLHFTDQRWALDLDGNAGVVAKILGAVFGAASVGYKDFVRIGLDIIDGMTGDLVTRYTNLVQIALEFKLGPAATNTDVVALLWTNVVGRPPTAEESSVFVNLLDSGSLTRANLGILASDHTLNLAQIDFVGLQLNGLAYSG